MQNKHKLESTVHFILYIYTHTYISDLSLWAKEHLEEKSGECIMMNDLWTLLEDTFGANEQDKAYVCQVLTKVLRNTMGARRNRKRNMAKICGITKKEEHAGK